MNSAFQFATFAAPCLFPLLVVITAAAGRDITKVIIVRLGLNPQAAKDVHALIGPGNQKLGAPQHADHPGQRLPAGLMAFHQHSTERGASPPVGSP